MPKPIPTLFKAPRIDDRRIWDIWQSCNLTTALVAAYQVGIFELLEKSPRSANDVSRRLRINPRGTRAVLDLLVSLELLGKRGESYRLTECARIYLLKSSPFSWGAMFDSIVKDPFIGTCFEELRKKPAVQDDSRFTDFWAQEGLTQEVVQDFTRAMHAHSFAASTGLADRLKFPKGARVLDIAGGSGALSIALALKSRQANFVVAELPNVVPITKEYIARFGLSDRIEAIPLNMFKDPWPKGFDAILFSEVFHDYDEKDCERLAKKAATSLVRNGKIVLQEILISEDSRGPVTAAAFSVGMFLTTKGKQYTLSEFRSILQRAGFKQIQAKPSFGYFSMVTGTRA